MASLEQISNSDKISNSNGIYNGDNQPLTNVAKSNKEMAPRGLLYKQLRALFWKSFITRRIHYISTILELFGPILLILLFCFVYKYLSPSPESNYPNEEHRESTNGDWEPPKIYNITYDIYNRNLLISQIYYAPENDHTRMLFSYFENSIIKVHGFPDEQALKDKINLIRNETNFAAKSIFGIYFNHLNYFGTLNYKLIYGADKTDTARLNQAFPFKISPQPNKLSQSLDYIPFVTISNFINNCYLKTICHKFQVSCDDYMKKINVRLMPYPGYNKPKITEISIQDVFGVLIVLSYLLICPLIVKRICDEKSTKAKELLSMMGMSNLIYWSSHFINYFIILFFQAVIITALIYYFKIIVFTNFFLLFIGLLFFMAQMILFAMLISTILNRPVIGVIVTVIVWVVAVSLIIRSLIPSFQFGSDYNVSQTMKYRFLTSFLPFGSIIWIFSIVGIFETSQVGLNFSNMARSTIVYNDFTYLIVLIMMIISFFVYFFLIWYLDNVWPFQFGIPKSPFFFLKPSYWFIGSEKNAAFIESLDQTLDPKIFEQEPTNLNKLIQVRNLYKVFKNITGPTKVAVDQLSFNIYENQATILLGHNGAGKTTTMSMITGMYNATSGSVFVNGYNVFSQTHQARRSIGLCPQENIFFNELTVYQHLKLFALLKNQAWSTLDAEVNKLIDLLHLKEKKNTLAINLSGGMKRKLQLGMALIGETKILILDEPTSGMDPETRRVIWDLLLSIRRERTILLTTHFMEEADILGDRIIIMNNGKVCCSGSSLFLKNAYGTGYMLRIAKLDGFDSFRFLDIVQHYIPNATLSSEMETEASYQLDFIRNKQLTSNLANLFNDIETNKSHYCIDSYGMSYTTLEDVFLKVGADIYLDNNDHSADVADRNNEIRFTNNNELLTGPSLIFNQCLGLFLKRFHFAVRYWPMFILQILIPTLIIIGALIIDNAVRSESTPYKDYENELILDLKTIYGLKTRPFFSGNLDYYEAYEMINVKNGATDIFNITKSNDINNWLMTNYNGDLSTYINDYLYGIVYNANQFDLWFNNEQYHSFPLSLIIHYETLLWKVLPEKYRNEVSIQVVNTPLLLNKQQDDINVIYSLIISWAITCLFMIPIAFPFLAASYILFPIKEQKTKAKLIQLMTGLSPIIFWIMNFIFDLLQHLLAVLVVYIVIFFFDSNHVFFHRDQSNSSGIALFFMLFSFGLSSIPLSYLLSYFFSTPSSGFIIMVIIYILFGLIANLIFSVIDLLVNFLSFELFMPLSDYYLLLNFLRLFPIFSFLFGYQKVYKLSSFSQFCQSFPKQQLDQLCFSESLPTLFKGCCENQCNDKCFNGKNTFAMTDFGSGIEICFLLCFGVLCFCLIILYESYRSRILKFISIFDLRTLLSPKRSNTATVVSTDYLLGEDEDVLHEEERVDQEVIRQDMTDILTVHQLSKNFGNFTAVDRLSFSVHYDELFGLLGVNGAGKTTTFSMLTGDLIPSSGDAYMKDGQLKLETQTHLFQRNIGYCPQFDALIDNLNGVETLYLYARLRGVPSSNLARDVGNLIRMVGLEEHANRQVNGYSGGNRRKLSIAIAMIGNPCLLFLDEPTSGVDPAARRKIWETLRYIKKNFRSSIVLTSHSMEECEALCARIAIMVNGKFRCLGSTQHLRSKYAQGYFIMIRLRPNQGNDNEHVKLVQQDVQHQFPSASLKDFHQCMMHFQVIDCKETWSNLFSRMEDLSKKYDFEDYVISGTTLEQIFITFARAQKNSNKRDKE